jgi:hypothetical protein
MPKQIRLNAFAMNCVGHQSPGLWTHPSDRSDGYNTLGASRNANGGSGRKHGGMVEMAANGIRSDAAPGRSGAVGFLGHRGRLRIHHGADVESAEAQRARLGCGRFLCGRRSDCDVGESRLRPLIGDGGSCARTRFRVVFATDRAIAPVRGAIGPLHRALPVQRRPGCQHPVLRRQRIGAYRTLACRLGVHRGSRAGDRCRRISAPTIRYRSLST